MAQRLGRLEDLVTRVIASRALAPVTLVRLTAWL